MALPTSDTYGYGSYTGKTADGSLKTHVACDCLVAWLPALNNYLVHFKLHADRPLWIEQLTGGEPESAGTHTQGGAFDLGYSDKPTAMVCREMGAPATWVRLMPTFDIDHIHGVLSMCPHNEPARYQITAQAAGYNGLGYRGRGGYDNLPDPEVYRDWKQGIAWARGRISPTSFQMLQLEMGNTHTEVAKFQKWLWGKQPESYKSWFRTSVYNFDTRGFTKYYGSATGRMVADTYKRLHAQYPSGNWNYGVVNNVWPDEPGPKFIKFLGGSVYI